MGSDQVGAIRRVVLGLVHAQERNARNVENLYASIAVSGRADSCWVAIALGEINFAYPHRKSPLGFLKGRNVKALPGLAVEAFEPGQSATLSFARNSATARSFVKRGFASAAEAEVTKTAAASTTPATAKSRLSAVSGRTRACCR